MSRLNGVPMNLTNPEDISREGRAGKRSYERAFEAMKEAYFGSNKFDGMTTSQVLQLVDAALQDKFMPLKKMRIKRNGTRFKAELANIRRGDHASILLRS